MPGLLVTERKNIQKLMPVKVKDVDAKQGIVCAYGSSFNVIDDNYPIRDVMKPGAFKKTIVESGPKGANRVLFLWDHKPDLMLGKPQVLVEDQFGLYFESKVVRNSYGNDYFMLYEAEVVNEHSIGYFVIKSSYGETQGEKVRFLEELALLEVSGVPWGMNPITPTVGIKGNQDALERMATQLQRIQGLLHSGHFQTDEMPRLLEKQTQELELLLKAVQPPEPTHESITTAEEYGTMTKEELAALVQAEVQRAMEAKDATGKTTWPLADRDTAWDSGKAHDNVVAWAKTDDGYDVGKLESVHFYSPGGGAGENVSAYKLLFCDIIGGKPQAIPNAIIACYGSHGVDATKGIEEGDKEAIHTKISTYCAAMRKQFDNPDGFVPSWESEKAGGKRMRRKDYRYVLAHKDYLNAVARQLHEQQKDYQGTLAGVQEDLQQCWFDAFYALVQCLIRDMWTSLYPISDDAPDAHTVVAADLDQFQEIVLALVDKSVAAQFVPCGDDDGHSFYDPSDDDDDDYGMMSAQLALHLKEGKPISAANHKALSTAHAKIADGLKDAQSVMGKLKPSAGSQDDGEADTSDDSPDNDNPAKHKSGAGAVSSTTGNAPAGATEQATPEKTTNVLTSIFDATLLKRMQSLTGDHEHAGPGYGR